MMRNGIAVLLLGAAALHLGCSSTADADARTVAEDAPANAVEARAAQESTDSSAERPDIVRMRGLFSYMADAAIFVDCDTGEKLPVAMEADYLALERAYLENREEPGQPLPAIIDGSVVERPAMEGDAFVNTVIVDRFIEVRVGESCKTAKPDVPLRNTYWKLMRVDGRPVEVKTDQREPHIILDLREMSLEGYGGCNQLMGSFEIEGGTLRFGPIAGTKRYCMDTMDLESAFLEALGKVTRFEISGETLTLYGSEENVALLEARYFD